MSDNRINPNEDQSKIIDAISSNKVCYPMSNKIWFNNYGGEIIRTIYNGKQKRYIVAKKPWNLPPKMNQNRL